MTDLETAIMIKNMARETVRRMSATAKNANVQMGGMDVTLKSGKKANARLILSEKNLEAARKQAEKYLASLGVSEKEYLFDGINHIIYFYKNK